MNLPELEDIGSRVAWARTHTLSGQLTREELADKLSGKTPNPTTWIHLQMVEGNNLDPVALGMCPAIAEATGVSVDWLTSGTTHKSRVLPAKGEPIFVAPTKPSALRPGEMKPVDPGTLGSKVREARKARGLSQAQLGAEIGMNNWMVSRIELNRFETVHPESAAALLAYLNINEPWPKVRGKNFKVSPWKQKVSAITPEPVITEPVVTQTVLPPRKEKAKPVVDNLMRPRLVTQVRINADDSAFYLICGRKSFKRGDGGDVTEAQEPIGAFAFNPRLMKSVLTELTEAVRQYEDTFGPIR